MLFIGAGISGRSLAQVVRGELGRGFALADIKLPSLEDATTSVSRVTGGTGGTAGLYEVFHDPLGHYFDNGKIVQGQIGDHTDHVHVAGETARLHSLAALAHNQFHLHIRQFGPSIGRRFPESETAVSLGHVGNSFHYTGKAFDASGSAADMLAFARFLIGE